MPLTPIESTENLKIRFDGETNQIEAETLINSLIHFTNIVHEVNKELNTERKLEIKINSLPKGSFIIDVTLQAIVDGVHTIFTKENIAVAKQVMDTVTGVFNLGKFLKGKAPKEVNTQSNGTTVYNTNGSVIVINNPVYNIYKSNRNIQDSLTQEFETLAKDSHVKGFEILDDKDNKLVDIPKDDFFQLANPEKFVAFPDEQLLTKIVVLNISTLSFEPTKKWTFYYEGNKIQAKISPDFSLRIDAGEKFAKGDSLKAEIEIQQVFDKSVNTYINKSFRILQILEHYPRSEQLGLGM
jgi:hypothetical protein